MEINPTFQSYFNNRATIQVQAPGRVNLLGEHVDYNQGPVLPAAIDLAVYLAAKPFDVESATRKIIHLYAIDLDESVQIHLDQLPQKIDILGNPLPKWAYYPAGVAWALQETGYQVMWNTGCLCFRNSNRCWSEFFGSR